MNLIEIRNFKSSSFEYRTKFHNSLFIKRISDRNGSDTFAGDKNKLQSDLWKVKPPTRSSHVQEHSDECKNGEAHNLRVEITI